MSDLHDAPVEARISTKRSRRISIIWVIPLVALAIGAWLLWDTLSREGPTITVTFDSAEGLQAGKSQLKFKDIVFGTVTGLRLSPDHGHVIVTIATTRDAAPLLTDKTVFWVVKPRLFAGAVSGVETLLSGSYVGMLPGATAGNPERAFTGREDPPILQANVPGRVFLLKAKRLGSISLGSPVYYRDLSVGEVLGWDIGDMARSVTIRTFVRAPYDSYVHDDTRFWNASGLSVKLAATGVQVQLESLRALLLGGIAFDNPAVPGPQAPKAAADENHVFPLFADRETADAASYTRQIRLVSYFPGSVSGLEPGSKVTMRGLVIGRVTGVRLAYDPAKEALLAPVHFEVEPERIVGIGAKAFATPAEAMQALLDKGLRASLQSASLITGQQQVALDFVPNAPRTKVEVDDGSFVLPTAKGGGFAGLQASANNLLDKINAMPLDEIGQNLAALIKSANELATGPQMRDSLTRLAAMIATLDTLTQKLDRGTAPALRNLPKLTAQLNATLANANRLLVSLNRGYGDNTRINRELAQLLSRTNEAVAAIRSLANLLTRHPEALIKGRPSSGFE